MIRTEHTPQPNGIAARAIAVRDGVPMIATLGTEWARQVNEAWQSTLDGILEAGRLLILAKAELEHGEWEAMVENQLSFGMRTAQMLMKIAADERIANAKHRFAFPPSWGTLYDLTKLPDDVFEAKLADGSIHPGMQRKDVAFKATKAPKDMEIAEAQQEVAPVKSSGPRINIPDDTTAEAHCRKGMAMEADGLGTEEAANNLGVGARAYRQMRDVVLLADRGGFSESDSKIVARALALMNETRRVGDPWAMIEPIAAKVWGSGSDSTPRAVREAKRIERFEHSFGVIMQGCLIGAELDLPYLTADRVKKAVREINAARRGLSDLLNRIKGVHE